MTNVIVTDGADFIGSSLADLGREVNVTILELAELIIRMTGSSSRVEFLPPLAEGDMTRRQPDAAKMKKILDNKLISLEGRIRRILDSGIDFCK